MKKYRLFSAISLVAVLLLSACSQDELAEQGTTLPEGEYPLQIGSVSITAEAGEQPWTRVTENNTDGMSSVWQNGDKIGVRIGDSEETGIYVVNVDENGTVTSITPDKPVYWTNTQPATVTAWYPATNGAVSLEYQDDEGLSYVLHGTGTGNHQTPVTLNFTHQLAKVRVITRGTADVSGFEVFAPYNCYVEEGEIISAPSSPTDRIPMRQSAYEDIGTCWEANAVPGELPRYEVHCRNGYSGVYALPSPMTLEAGKLHTITLTLNRKGTIDLSQRTETYTIATDGDYYFNGTGSYGIRVTGGNPTIYLGDAHISVTSGNAISIEGGNATIHVMGENTVKNTQNADNGAGIYVAKNATVTITGRDRNDVLTAIAGGDAAGIGGCSNNQDCGAINISNVTVIARGSGLSSCSPGIGSTQTNQCGNITIDNATVHAYGTGLPVCACPGIGAGLDDSGSTGTVAPNVTIQNHSEVHAHRGNSYADYIGLSCFMTSGGGQVRASVDETSVVYKYTGNGNTPDQ